MRVRAFAAMGAAAALAAMGCSYARGAGAPMRGAAGRAGYAPGVGEGYWIWQDASGWHLRTTSDLPRRFQGSVETVGGGTIESLKPVGVAGVSLAANGRRLEFQWAGEAVEQGFDWASPSGCNRFAVYVDGEPRPLDVHLGAADETPARVPFAVCR